MTRKRSAPALLAARDLRTTLRIRGPSDLDLELAAMYMGAQVEWLPLTNEDAHVREIDGVLVIGLAERLRDSRKSRLDLAHEIGHLVLHGVGYAVSCPSVALRKGDASAEERKKYWSSEREASDFAAELTQAEDDLTPLLDVPPDVPFSLDEVRMIADGFGLSFSATGIRCAEIASHIPCAITKSIGGLIDWHAMSDAFGGKIVKGRSLHPRALAKLLQEDGERIDGEVPGEVWGGWGVDVMREQSFRGGGVVLTWLWHPPV